MSAQSGEFKTQSHCKGLSGFGACSDLTVRDGCSGPSWAVAGDCRPGGPVTGVVLTGAGRPTALSPLPPGLGRHLFQGLLLLQTLPWRSSCSRVTCTRCCSWTHPSPMHPQRAGSAKLRKARGRSPRPCGPPTDPTAPAGPRAELPVSGVRWETRRGRERLGAAVMPTPGACQTVWLPSP